MTMNRNSQCFAPFVYTMSATRMTLVREVGVQAQVFPRGAFWSASAETRAAHLSSKTNGTDVIGLGFVRLPAANSEKVNDAFKFELIHSRAP